jgi:hypothetical protein
MKADLRISIKDYRRNENLKVLLHHVPFTRRQGCQTATAELTTPAAAGSADLGHGFMVSFQSVL